MEKWDGLGVARRRLKILAREGTDDGSGSIGLTVLY
jgi:hypothetical protein